ncbi:MAG: metal-sulfur cluster assembly factor [Elusimicrobia bacterium]|nr:metal-sulfur cluster assembly factor [Elusimicrobiota bacterium]
MVQFTEIRDALMPIEDPEIHLKVLDLGLLYGVEICPGKNGDKVKVLMTLTSPACPYGPMLLAQIHGALAKVAGIRDVEVNLTFDPTWDPRTMATEETLDALGIF